MKNQATETNQIFMMAMLYMILAQVTESHGFAVVWNVGAIVMWVIYLIRLFIDSREK